MALSLVTAATEEPVSLDEAKTQCRVDTDDEQLLLIALIQAARDYAETFTHRALITQVWDLKLDAFPDDDTIWVPKPPLQTTPTAPVVTYVDSNGTTQTVSSTLYTIDAPAGPHARMARIVPAYSCYWPTTRDVPNAVTVRFYAGYGLQASVPAAIKTAIKLLVAQWFSNRAATGAANLATIPLGVDALLWPYKAF